MNKNIEDVKDFWENNPLSKNMGFMIHLNLKKK